MLPDMQIPSLDLHITPEVAAHHPRYQALVLVAENLQNGPSTSFTDQLLQQVEEEVRSRFEASSLKDHPHTQAWREAYRSFGMKPQRFQNSAEALISRVLKGNPLPRINRLVDVYNLISVRYALPCGGEDIGHVQGTVSLMYATGTEVFDTVKEGQQVTEHPQVGEVVWADDLGVTCRAWNWRQGTRTRLTGQTHSAYFLLEHLLPDGQLELEAAGKELHELLLRVSPKCLIRERWLRERT